MNPIISVLISTYNRRNVIGEALQSVCMQRPENFEIIVADDGSSDDTVQYLKLLRLPITLIEGKHRGVAATRNNAIRKSNASFISFLDSDDIWLSGILSAQLNYLKTHNNIPLVYTDQYIQSNNHLLQRTRFQNVNLTDKQKRYFHFPSFVQFVPIQISSVMVRKSIFDEVGYFDERLNVHEDSELWNRICEKHSLGYVEQPFSIKRCGHSSNQITNPENRYLYCRDGRKYLQIYEERRKNTLSKTEKVSILKSYRIIDEIEHSSMPLHFHLKEFK